MLQARSWLPRTEGSVRLGFVRRGEETALAALRQAGAARVRFPNPADGDAPEAVLLNTAGGLTGGDRFDVEVRMGAGTDATVTTASAEKIYRARDGDTDISVTLDLEPGARLAWLPQPTILFDQSRLNRRTTVSLAGTATFVAVETLIFGRTAMGEDVRAGACRDAWRVHRDGVLLFADTFRAGGAIADALNRPAHARWRACHGHAPLRGARRGEPHRQGARAVGECAGDRGRQHMERHARRAGDGARGPHPAAGALRRSIAWLSGRPLPRVWQC